MEQKAPKRAKIRFKPSVETLAVVDTSPGKGKSAASIPCLILNESFSGCALVALAIAPFDEGDLVRVKLGSFKAMPSEVRWKRNLDKDVIVIGIEYRE